MQNCVKFYANGFCQVDIERRKSELIFRYREIELIMHETFFCYIN